jgi:hypothetical protein
VHVFVNGVLYDQLFQLFEPLQYPVLLYIGGLYVYGTCRDLLFEWIHLFELREQPSVLYLDGLHVFGRYGRQLPELGQLSVLGLERQLGLPDVLHRARLYVRYGDEHVLGNASIVRHNNVVNHLYQ